MDSFSDPEDKKEIHDLRAIIEQYRDFIIWLCEEELDSSVTEKEEEFKKWEEIKYGTS